MKKRLFAFFCVMIVAFMVLDPLNMNQLKSHIFIAKYSNSFSYEGPYAYVGINGDAKSTIANGSESHMMYELLGAIEAKYGIAAAQTYLACAQTGDYSAYYSTVGSTRPTFYEGFKYSTNGNQMEKFGPMSVECMLEWAGVTSVSSLLTHASAAGYSSGAEYAKAVKKGIVAKPTPSSTNTQAAAKQPETVVADAQNTEQKEQKEPEPKKEISHGIYEEISEEAENAFVELLSDGVEDSCYIQVKANAEDRIISAGTVSQTLKQKENGRVEFYNIAENEDDKAFVYSVTFPQIEVTEDIELAAAYTQNDTSKYENVYQFSFVDKQELPSEVEVCVNVSGNAGDKYYLLRGNGDTDYNVFATAECDENGHITYKTKTLDSVIITTTDIISIRQAEEEALKKEQAEKEAAEKAEQEDLAKANESSTQNAEDVEAAEAIEPTEKTIQNYTLYLVIGAAIILGLVMMIAGVAVYRKNH